MEGGNVGQQSSFVISPYVGVGPLRFGMGAEEVALHLGAAEDNFVDFLKRRVEIRAGVSTKYNRKGQLNEVSFLKSERVILDGIALFTDKAVLARLDALDAATESVGFRIYMGLGIAMTGFGKSRETRTLSVFARELRKLWKE